MIWNPLVLKAFLTFHNKDINNYKPKTEKHERQFSTMFNGDRPTSMRDENNTISDSDFQSPVNSTAIAKASHDGKNTAKIQFTNSSKEYEYDVTPNEYEQFLRAPSKGRFVAMIWNHNPAFHKNGPWD